MAFDIVRKVTTDSKEVKTPVNTENLNKYKTVLAKYDGREISSETGCIAKDLYCSKIHQITGAVLPPDLYIDDYVLK